MSIAIASSVSEDDPSWSRDTTFKETSLAKLNTDNVVVELLIDYMGRLFELDDKYWMVFINHT